jgi:thiopurine S-methyltransferase
LSEVNPVIEKYGHRFLVDVSPTTPTAEEEEEVDATTSITPPTCKESSSNNNNTRVFVPLCGKTVDMAYLATTSYTTEVVGVEGIRLALEEFATEHPSLKIKSDTTIIDGFERFVGDKIILLKGDYFDLDPIKTGGTFGLIYDRASFVAIDPSLRLAYVEVQGKLLAKGGKILLIALERKGSEYGMKQGPPFSLTESTVRNLYESQDWVQSIELLEQTDQLVTNPEDKERYPDLDQLLETVYCIQTKA